MPLCWLVFSDLHALTVQDGACDQHECKHVNVNICIISRQNTSMNNKVDEPKVWETVQLAHQISSIGTSRVQYAHICHQDFDMYDCPLLLVDRGLTGLTNSPLLQQRPAAFCLMSGNPVLPLAVCAAVADLECMHKQVYASTLRAAEGIIGAICRYLQAGTHML